MLESFFLSASHETATVYKSSFNMSMVFVSVLIAVFSAICAFEMVERLARSAKRRVKLSRVLGKRALKSFHPRLFNNRLFAGDPWSDKNGCSTRNHAATFC